MSLGFLVIQILNSMPVISSISVWLRTTAEKLLHSFGGRKILWLLEWTELLRCFLFLFLFLFLFVVVFNHPCGLMFFWYLKLLSFRWGLLLLFLDALEGLIVTWVAFSQLALFLDAFGGDQCSAQHTWAICSNPEGFDQNHSFVLWPFEAKYLLY